MSQAQYYITLSSKVLLTNIDGECTIIFYRQMHYPPTFVSGDTLFYNVSRINIVCAQNATVLPRESLSKTVHCSCFKDQSIGSITSLRTYSVDERLSEREMYIKRIE